MDLKQGIGLRNCGGWLSKSEVRQEARQSGRNSHKQTEIPGILYNDYCLLVGYGYNYVLGRKWLLNLTLTPYIGYRYNITVEPGQKRSDISLNLRGRIGLVYNHKKFFMGLQGYADHHRYKVKDSRLYNSMIELTALAGIRF